MSGIRGSYASNHITYDSSSRTTTFNKFRWKDFAYCFSRQSRADSRTSIIGDSVFPLIFSSVNDIDLSHLISLRTESTDTTLTRAYIEVNSFGFNSFPSLQDFKSDVPIGPFFKNRHGLRQLFFSIFAWRFYFYRFSRVNFSLLNNSSLEYGIRLFQ